MPQRPGSSAWSTSRPCRPLHARWRANERAISTDEPLPSSWLAPTVTAALAAVVVVVGVLVAVEFLVP